MSTVKELEFAQLRLSLLALHRRALLWGPLRNFFILFALLIIITAGATGYFMYFLWTHTAYSYAAFGIMIPIFTLTIPGYFLQQKYLVELPATKNILAFFEHNHPEMCSWLPESALLEAKMLYEQKAL